jgi:nucleotide-binding universal stress UspA family protein
LEAVVINHILVPLDGSELAECVLPHVMAIASVTNALITTIHVLERQVSKNGSAAIDPVGWHMQKQEAQSYLDRAVKTLQKGGLRVEQAVMEGNPAEAIIDYANSNTVDLIVLSSHGRTGLGGWNMSSVVQNILLRSYKSTLLVRAFAAPLDNVRYNRLFLASDGSTRSEYILPFALTLAQAHHSQVIFGTVIQKPQTIQRFPLSDEVADLIEQLIDKNRTDASRYLDQLSNQLSLKGLSASGEIVVAENVIGALYDMVEESHADLVMIAAHGHSGERRWPYGSIAASLIAYGSMPLMIMQDLSENDIPHIQSERATREGKGR